MSLRIKPKKRLFPDKKGGIMKEITFKLGTKEWVGFILFKRGEESKDSLSK